VANDNTSYEKWYQKTWLIFLSIIVAWPIGLVLTWMGEWRTPTKVMITITIVLLVAYACMRTGSLLVFFWPRGLAA
jgi:hypothetical protein